MKKSQKATSVERRRLSLERLEERQMLAVTYWVDDNDPGSNSGAGDYGTVITNPFVTIQEAAAVAAAGDTINIREGLYRETITPANSGTAADPIVYQAYNGEQVTVSGAETISGFTQLTGDVYQANMPGGLGLGSDQIFVNGQMMLWARWPNTLSLDVSRPVWDTNSTINSTSSGTNAWDVSLTDTSFPGDASDYADGYVQIAPLNAWVQSTGLIRATSSGDTIEFDLASAPYEPGDDDRYFIKGTFNALDSAGEWFRDSGGTLSLWQPGGGDPDASTVEFKARDYAFELGGIDYVTLDGIDLFASTIRMDQSSDYNTIQNMDAKYLSHSEFVVGSPWVSGTIDNGIILDGSNNTLRDSTIAYSSGNGVTVSGSNQRIINNTIRDTNYLGTDASAIYTESTLGSPAPNPVRNIEIAYNTIYDTGRTGINIRYVQGANILHNEVYNYMLQTTDGGGIATYGINDGPDFNDGKGTVIAYNLVHDSYALDDTGTGPRISAGIYMDSGSNGYTINDNIVWNTGGALGLNTHINDQDHKIYNNTFVGEVLAIGAFGPAGQQNETGTEFWNNLVVGDVDLYTPSWNSNGSNYVTTFANIGSVGFVDSANGDFRLTAGSPAIDFGTATPPYTRGALGAAPDAGAIEFNTPAFTAGVGSNRDLDGNAINVGSGTTSVTAGYYDTYGPSGASHVNSEVTPYTNAGDTAFLYQFDEASGTLATDSSSNGFNLLSFDSPFGTATGPTGLNGAAGAFDDADKSLRIGLSAAQIDSAFDLQNFTIEAWVRNPTLAAGGGDAIGIMQMRNATGGGRISMRIDNSGGKLQLSVDNAVGGGFTAIKTTNNLSFATDEWYHLAITYAGDGAGGDSVVRFYQTPLSDTSGVATLLETVTGVVDVEAIGTATLRIGVLDDSDTRTFGGDLDEVRYTNATLGAGDFNLPVVTGSTIDLSSGGSYYDSDQTNSAASPIRPNDAVDANSAGVVGGIAEGEWLEYTLDVQTAGTYDLTFELGAFGAGDSVITSIRNSSGFTTVGTVTTADLVSGNDYRLSGVSLDAGLQVVRIQFGGDGFDFTQFEIDGGIAVVSADFDGDNDIDGFDFLSWQRGFGIQAPNAVKTDGDADNDADVDATDLGFWEAQFGGPAPLAASQATEPAAVEALTAPALVSLATVATAEVEVPVAAATVTTPTAAAPAPVVSVVTTETPVAAAERIDAAVLALAYQTTSDLVGTGRSLLEEVDPISHTALAHDRFLELSQDLGILRDRIATDVSSFRDQVTSWTSSWSEELDSHQEELAFETALEQLFGR